VSEAPGLRVVHDIDEAVSVRVMGGGSPVEILRYVYRSRMPAVEAPKPYFHPLRTLAGDVVTGYRPHDHRWHKGIQMTVSHLSGENFWGGGSYVRGRGYLDLPNVGSMRHEDFASWTTARDQVSLNEWLTWRTQTGEQWVDERRELTVRDVEDESWALEFGTELTNVRGAPLEIGSPTTHGRPWAGYSGLFWRGPRAFTDGEVIAADGQGGPEMMGKAARWLAYVGTHDEVDRTSTLLFIEDPRDRCLWFVRNTPFPAVNPSLAFHDEITLPPGETLRRRYRIIVANGAWDRDRLESYVKEHR
jgi:hypothetical protein